MRASTPSRPGGTIGQPVSRVDGALKVTGRATYTAEFDAGATLAHGVVVESTVAAGRIVEIDTIVAETAAGVLAVLTHRNARARALPRKGRSRQRHALHDDRVRHQGQPVALVVANTLEQATHAASLVRVTYREARAVTAFDEAARRAVAPGPEHRDDHPGATRRGAPAAALQKAAVRIDAEYVIPREHHNPIEPHATIAAWDGDTLTLWDKTQAVDDVRDEVADVFGLSAERVRVVSPFVGGAFGSGLQAWPHVILAATAARVVGRPVKVGLTRRQMYGATGYRPRTTQRVSLGATRTGKLVAIRHEGVAETSAHEQYTENLVQPTRYLYRSPNVATRYRLAPMHVNTPTWMRAPGEATGMFALECAMDELAVALGMDPVELRLANDTSRDAAEDRPFSSRALRQCFATAAERFGWARRDPRPASMRDAQGRLVGYGCASATYPVNRDEASARACLLPDGSAVVASATSDMGPGTYTSLTQVAADTLGLPLGRVRVEIGDSRLPAAPAHGGSMTMATVGSAVQAACAKARRTALARIGPSGAGLGLADVMRRLGRRIEVTATSGPGDERERYSMHAFGAVFAHVTVDPNLGEVRVPRIVGAYGAGRIVNPTLARSQVMGGMVMGIGMALMERTVVDARTGRVVNGNLAEYLVPVNADVGELDVTFVREHDRHVNPLGVKGVAEIAVVGVAAAIANAVHHATGRRVRALPILPDVVLRGAAEGEPSQERNPEGRAAVRGSASRSGSWRGCAAERRS